MTSPDLLHEPRSEIVARAALLGVSVAIRGNRVLIVNEGMESGYLRNGRPAHELRPEDARDIAADLVRAADVIDGKLANSGGGVAWPPLTEREAKVLGLADHAWRIAYEMRGSTDGALAAYHLCMADIRKMLRPKKEAGAS